MNISDICLLEKFNKLNDSGKVRIIFHPLALAVTQMASLSHYLFVPGGSYFTPPSVIVGLIAGGTVAATAEIFCRFLRKNERIRQENELMMEYATGHPKTLLHVVEIMPDGEVVYRFANDAYKKRTSRYIPENLMGRKYSEFHTPEETAAYLKQLNEVLQSGQPFEYEKINRRGSVSKRTLMPHVHADTGRRFVTIAINDIRELKELQQQLAEAAYHDTLTGIANRRLLNDRARLAKNDLDRDRHGNRNDTCIGILKTDLDNFKFNNDTYGHAVGDELLVEVAKRLQRCVRSVDTVAREGGDEFTLLLPKTSTDGAVIVALKIISEINRPYNINNIECYLGISIGICFYPQDGATFKEIFMKADKALYEAKQAGRNTYRIFDEVKDQVTLTKGPSR